MTPSKIKAALEPICVLIEQCEEEWGVGTDDHPHKVRSRTPAVTFAAIRAGRKAYGALTAFPDNTMGTAEAVVVPEDATAWVWPRPGRAGQWEFSVEDPGAIAGKRPLYERANFTVQAPEPAAAPPAVPQDPFAGLSSADLYAELEDRAEQGDQAAKEAVAPAVPEVRVKALEWANVGRCIGWSADDEQTHLYHARGLDRLYEVARGKVGWWAKWKGGFHAKELPTLDEAKAAAQADYSRRILAALETPAGEAVAPFGYWIEHVRAEPCFLRAPAYIPPSGGNYTVTPLFAHPAPNETETLRREGDGNFWTAIERAETAERERDESHRELSDITGDIDQELAQKRGAKTLREALQMERDETRAERAQLSARAEDLEKDRDALRVSCTQFREERDEARAALARAAEDERDRRKASDELVDAVWNEVDLDGKSQAFRDRFFAARASLRGEKG